MTWTALALRRVCWGVLTMELRDTLATTDKMPLWCVKVPVVITSNKWPSFVMVDRLLVTYVLLSVWCLASHLTASFCEKARTTFTIPHFVNTLLLLLYKCFFVLIFLVVTTIQSNCSEGDVRLEEGSNEYEGRVEICINQVWGTICSGSSWSGYWGVADGRVVCRQLGHQELGKSDLWSVHLELRSANNLTFSWYNAGLTIYHRSTQFGQGTGPIFFTNIGCSGTESSLLECSRSVFGVTLCTQSRDVGVKCEGNKHKVV